MFSREDLQQMQEKGLDVKIIEKQIENYKKGFPFLELVEPATVENGISRLSKPEIKIYSDIYNKEASKYSILKFVPASGAATRMFKDLLAFKEKLEAKDLQSDENPPSAIVIFFENLQKFAFYEDLASIMNDNNIDIKEAIADKLHKTILDYLLTEIGLNYQQLPKALLEFHKYENDSRKAYEEHLVEGAEYCRDKDKIVNIHFTSADEHFNMFREQANRMTAKYEKLFAVKYKFDFSVQKPSTDIIAVDLNNNPFRDKNGRLVFRPGGHGALIENLNDCDNDLIFIKNIDNIFPDRLKLTTYQYKKALGGMLIQLYQKLSEYLEMLESNELGEDIIKEIEEFADQSLNLKIDNYYKKYTRINKINYLYFLLNRPVRICGMVRNTGEPGGGPFWVKETSGAISLQIVETSQIDLENKQQARILKHSTHFNPVDLVCFVKDYKGNKFDLDEFIDETTGFITLKSFEGKDLKAQELPGLWNGAMSDWITLFVEVPLTTFNPVKTINDLLRPEHLEELVVSS